MIYEENFQSRENPSEINVSSCTYYTQTAQGFPQHCHSFYEMQYSIEGKRSFYLNGYKFALPEKAICFVQPLAAHSIINEEPSTKNIIIQFSREFLYRNSMTMSKESILVPTGKMLGNNYICPEKGSDIARIIDLLIEITPIHAVSDQDVFYRVDGIAAKKSGRAIEIRPELEFRVKYDPSYELKLNSLILALLSDLLDEGYLTILDNVGKVSDAIKIQPILNRLISHPEDKITMEEAAQTSCMSYSNFCRLFKQLIGETYINYCNIVRVRRAEELLIDTNLSITEISEMLSFGTINYFNRIFKRYNGNSPFQYRKYMNETEY